MSHAPNGGEIPSEQEESETYGHNLLIEESPLLVLPSLAQAIGLEEAIVVQQLHWLLKPKAGGIQFGKVVDGRRWIFNTYEQWSEYFPFWSMSTLQRIFVRLEKMGIIMSCQPEGVMSRRKYYRIGEGVLNLIRKGKLTKPKRASRWDSVDAPRTHQLDKLVTSTSRVPITETTIKDSLPKETKESSAAPTHSLSPAESFPAKWIPDERTKEQKLRVIPSPRPGTYPSEEDFIEAAYALDIPGLVVLIENRDLYSELCLNKWHVWKPKLRRWVKISKWRNFIAGLGEKVDRAQDQKRGF